MWPTDRPPLIFRLLNMITKHNGAVAAVAVAVDRRAPTRLAHYGFRFRINIVEQR